MGMFDNWFGRVDRGTPVTTMRIYRFTPLDDMTAYELALILRNMRSPYYTNPLAESLTVDPMAVGADWYKVSRHFTLID